VLEYLDISTCNMEEGSLRCDANVSLREVGTTPLGAKVEIKNLNSFKAVKAALEYEMERQSQVLGRGQPVLQETRLWNAKSQVTESMRSKEEASDYRYFPEPDLVPFVIEPAVAERMACLLPELPAARRQRLMEAYGLSAYDAQVLTQHRRLADLFEQAATHYATPKPVANWIMGDVLAYLKMRSKEPEDVAIPPLWLVHLLEAIDRKTISGKMAKELFVEALDQQRDPEAIIQERGLRQIVDDGELVRLADEVIAGFPQSVQDYRRGKQNALMFLVGKCMQRSQGKASPQQLTEVLKRRLTQEVT